MSLIGQAERALARLLLVPAASEEELDRLFQNVPMAVGPGAESRLASEATLRSATSGRVYGPNLVDYYAGQWAMPRDGVSPELLARWNRIATGWRAAYDAALASVLDRRRQLDAEAEALDDFGYADRKY